jgi:glucose-6-phosphate 1-dehydrogenase
MKLKLIIFGVTSNLAQIKLIPALYDLEKDGLLPDDFSVIGIGRKEIEPKEFRLYLNGILNTKSPHHNHEVDPRIADNLLGRISYLTGDVNDPDLFERLKQNVKSSKKIFYLAVYPDLYKIIFNNLVKHGLSRQKTGWSRVVVEKPLGNNLKSAQELNRLLLKYFDEDQVYRLDHYLGKETLQNILDFRFGNCIFEPLMNNEYVDHIQITSAEDYGIGKRGNYYDNVGALKDVGQNHILQMLALITMKEPKNFINRDITAERIKLIKSLRPKPESVVFGQYEDYLNEENVIKNSNTETFFALETYINNQKFKGVPVFIRAGKMLARTVTEVAIVFKSSVKKFPNTQGCSNGQNALIYRIQPNEGIILKVLVRSHGYERRLIPSFMQFCHRNLPGEPMDPYERLLYDVLKGDQTFFNDAPEIEAQWMFADSFSKKRKPFVYSKGSWGPKQADELIEKSGRHWLEPSTLFCQF